LSIFDILEQPSLVTLGPQIHCVLRQFVATPGAIYLTAPAGLSIVETNFKALLVLPGVGDGCRPYLSIVLAMVVTLYKTSVGRNITPAH
jgi:hypothetical protein